MTRWGSKLPLAAGAVASKSSGTTLALVPGARLLLAQSAALALLLSGCQSSGTPAPAELGHAEVGSTLSDSESAKPQGYGTSEAPSPTTGGGSANPTTSDPTTGEPGSGEPAAADSSGGEASADLPPASEPGAGETAAAGPFPPGLLGGLRGMPASGKSNTEASGCLAKSLAEQAQTPVSRAQPKPDAVRITPAGNGIVVTHELSHACCLTSKTETKIEQQRVTISETLEGNACRCMCSSSLRTRVGLEPGSYTVAIKLTQAGKTKTVHEQSINVGIKKLQRR